MAPRSPIPDPEETLTPPDKFGGGEPLGSDSNGDLVVVEEDEPPSDPDED